MNLCPGNTLMIYSLILTSTGFQDLRESAQFLHSTGQVQAAHDNRQWASEQDYNENVKMII